MTAKLHGILDKNNFSRLSHELATKLPGSEFFIITYSEDKVYVKKPHSLQKQKDIIQTHIRAREPDTLKALLIDTDEKSLRMGIFA